MLRDLISSHAMAHAMLCYAFTSRMNVRYLTLMVGCFSLGAKAALCHQNIYDHDGLPNTMTNYIGGILASTCQKRARNFLGTNYGLFFVVDLRQTGLNHAFGPRGETKIVCLSIELTTMTKEAA